MIPKVHAVLTVPLYGSTIEKDRQAHGTETIDVPIRVSSVMLERNNHLQADECRLTAEYLDANLDPRFLKNASVQVWIGFVDGLTDFWAPTPKDLRFTGIAIEAKKTTREGSLALEMVFRDYTTLFLAQKPYPPKFVPSFKMTLREAWRLICDNTGYFDPGTQKIVSNVTALRENILLVNVDDVVIGEGVSDRLAKNGKISIRSGDSAWDVWQRCVYSRGLISWIDRDTVIVTNSTELWKESEGPQFLYGRNIYDLEETANVNAMQKGVAIVSYDVMKGKTVEAFYPLPGDERIHVKRGKVNSKKAPQTGDVQSDQYDYYEFHEVTDPVILEQIAKTTYDETCRQDLQGMLKTAEPIIDNVNLLDLGANQCITVALSQDTVEILKALGSREAQRAYLISRGYSEPIAALMIGNLDGMTTLKSVYHTKTVIADIKEGEMWFTIHYQNKINPVGDTGD